MAKRESKYIGYVLLYRSIQYNFIWDDKPFARGQAFIDLILMANHDNKKTILNGGIVEVKRGERITSLRQLANRWGWGTGKVKSFLELLQSEGMISYKSDTKKTTYKVLNYGRYQDFTKTNSNSEQTENEQQSDSNQTTIEQQSKTDQKQIEFKSKQTKNDRNNDRNNDEDKDEVLAAYCELIDPLPTTVQISKMDSWQQKHGMEPEVIIRGMHIARDNGIRNFRYLERTIESWLLANIKTAPELERHVIEFQEQKKRTGSRASKGATRTSNRGNYEGSDTFVDYNAAFGLQYPKIRGDEK